jgi:DNA-binding response OmpR family regulator
MFPPQVVRKLAGMRVLLIEDDSVTAHSIDLMLKPEGFNVYTTDLGEEGILLDLNLPDISASKCCAACAFRR